MPGMVEAYPPVPPTTTVKIIRPIQSIEIDGLLITGDRIQSLDPIAPHNGEIVVRFIVKSDFNIIYKEQP